MGKKNRNRGRDRYDDIYDSLGGNDFEYDGNFQSNYQDEIENAEFIDAEPPAQDASRKENTYPVDKNSAKSQAAEERDSWDFIKAKMDQTLSRFDEKKPASVKNGNPEKTEGKSEVEQTSETEQAPKEVKPKGPNSVTLLLGKIRALAGTLGTKLKSGKRKAKPENPQDETETTAETAEAIKSQNSLKNPPEKASEKVAEKPLGEASGKGTGKALRETTEVSSSKASEKENKENANPTKDAVSTPKKTKKSFFSFLKKKSDKTPKVQPADVEKTVEKTAEKAIVSTASAANEKGNPKADETGNVAKNESAGISEPSLEAQMRQKRKTYLLLGSITMSIVALLLIGIILLIVGKSGQEMAQVPQNSGETGSASSTDSTLNTGSALSETPALSTDSSLPVPSFPEVSEQEVSVMPSGSDPQKSPTAASTPSGTVQDSNPAKKVQKGKGKEKTKETEVPSLDSELGLESPEEMGLPNDSGGIPAPGESTSPQTASAENPQEDLTVGDVLNSDSETTPVDPNTTQAPATADSLLSSGNSTEMQPASAQTEAFTNDSAGLSTPEDSGNATLALPELNESSVVPDVSTPSNPSAQPESALTEETPSLETSPESVAGNSPLSDATGLDDATTAPPATPGIVTVAPTIARAENANTLPEGLETPEGVTPGSNVEEWNASTEEIPESFTAPQNPDAAGTKSEEQAEMNPPAAPADESSADSLTALSDSPADGSASPSGEPSVDPLAELSDSPENNPLSSPENNPLSFPENDPLSSPENNPLSSPGNDPLSSPENDPLSSPGNDPLSSPENDPLNSPGNESADPLSGLAAPLADEPATDPLASTSSDSPTDSSTDSSEDSLSERSESRPGAVTAEPTVDPLAVSSSDLDGELSSPDGLDDLGSPEELESGSPAPSDSAAPPSALGSLNVSREQEQTSGKTGKKAEYTNYTTVKDDSFWKISEKFYQTPAYENALARFNIDVVPDSNNLKEGTVLQIPALDFLRSCYPTLCPPLPSVAQVPAGENGTQTRGVQFYCVAEGDTLSLIAEKLLGDASRWPEIYRMNIDKIQNLDLLPVGEKLQIPMDEAIPPQNIWQ